MPFPRPTLSDLRQQTATDINAALPGVDALLRYSNEGIVAEVLAALADGHYGYLDWIARQSVPFTATDEYLEGWAALAPGKVIRKPATPASGSVTFAASAGTTLLKGTEVIRRDGQTYVTTADATAANGSVTAPVTAGTTGAGGNADAGVTLNLGVGVSGVSATGSAAGPITGGADIETDDQLRTRMLAAYAAPAQGGSVTDYPNWALTVPGVTRAWLKPGGLGPGTLVLLFMMDDAQAAHGGFPQGTNGVSVYEGRDTAATGDQLAVANALFGRQSATPIVYAVAPLPNTLNFTIAGLSTASGLTKTAIANAIAGALRSNAVPGGITNVSAIEAAIAAVPSAVGFIVTSITASAGSVDNGGLGNINSNAGALPALGTVTFL